MFQRIAELPADGTVPSDGSEAKAACGERIASERTRKKYTDALRLRDRKVGNGRKSKLVIIWVGARIDLIRLPVTKKREARNMVSRRTPEVCKVKPVQEPIKTMSHLAGVIGQ